MRTLLVLMFFLTSFEVVSQNVVKGFVIDLDGNGLPKVLITEVRTANRTETNTRGYFTLTTANDTSHIAFSYIGLDSQTIVITADTTLNIILTRESYDTRWLTFGISHAPLNSAVGFQISNGVDEEPLIHFEDFQDNVLFKVHAQSDFNRNYSYGAELGIHLLRYIGRTTLKYDVIRFKEADIFLTDFNLTSKLRYFGNTGLIFRTGYQKFNDKNKFGLGLGLEQNRRNFYIGINSRYYFDYFHHEVYLQYKIPAKSFISFLTVYNRIDDKNLLSLGLNYSFARNSYRQ